MEARSMPGPESLVGTGQSLRVGGLGGSTTRGLSPDLEADAAAAGWWHAVLTSMPDPSAIIDDKGRVLELNEAFTALLGYSMAEGELRPPYPWWPTEEEDGSARAALSDLHSTLLGGSQPAGAEVMFYTADRRPVCIELRGSSIEMPVNGQTAHLRTLRDITRNLQAQQRRSAAASMAGEFAAADELATLLSLVHHAFDLLLGGAGTVELGVASVRYLGSARSSETRDLGRLVVPSGLSAAPRAWVEFRQPTLADPDEVAVAELLAQAFGLAAERILLAQRGAAERDDLRRAVASHELIGQAVGVLVERHRILPEQAFEKLKAASQRRNVKLRDIAAGVVETGAEPGAA